jgi:SpoVK/Ycf46/Vps4 family AAA+-type ATPase
MINLSSGYLEDGLESIFKVDFSVDKMHHVFRGFQIQFLPEKKEEVEELVELVEKSMMKKISEASLQMICKSNGSFYLTPITIKKPLITDIKLHYGEEFEETHNTILKSLKCEESHGLILLHGLPGSGKTHYIRYLIQEFTDKQLIYVPPDMTSSISTPEFFPFMLQNKDSILIIEDAENIIKSREDKTSTTQSVANLLNLSDGLLGDSLHQPIIATFNCEINSIDSALLRKGRLICQHEFSKLSVENAQKLSNQLGFSTKIVEPMTLADIYGQDKKD